MPSLIYNEHTKPLIDTVTTQLPHALLLEGIEGVGLATIAKTIAWRDLAGFIQPTDIDGHVDTTSKGIVRIGQIRELVATTRSRFTKRHVIIIDDADKMNTQAQNAFLKLLEEPAPNIHFILTAHAAHRLLPTILSRLQRLTVQPISLDQSRRFITKSGINDPRKTQQLLFLASGRPAELARLIQNDSNFAARAGLMADARTFIQGRPPERTIIAAQYAKDRVKTLQLLKEAQAIIAFSLAQAPTRSLIDLSDRLATAYDRISANGNTRLQLMQVVVQ